MGWAASPARKSESLFSTPIIQMGARVYLPTLGRFLQIDPIEGGTANDYVYALDPVNSSDYSGLASFSLRSWLNDRRSDFLTTWSNPFQTIFHGWGKTQRGKQNNVAPKPTRDECMQVNNRDSGKGDYNPTVVRSFDLKMKTFRKNFGTQRSRQSEQNASKSNDIYDPCDREHGIPLYNPERHLRSKPSVAEQAFNYGTKGIIIGGAVAGGVLSAYLMPVSAIPIAQGAADMAY